MTIAAPGEPAIAEMKTNKDKPTVPNRARPRYPQFGRLFPLKRAYRPPGKSQQFKHSPRAPLEGKRNRVFRWLLDDKLLIPKVIHRHQALETAEREGRRKPETPALARRTAPGPDRGRVPDRRAVRQTAYRASPRWR